MYKKQVTISISRSRCQTPVRNLQHPPKPKIRTSRTWMLFAPSKSRQRAKIVIIGVSKTNDYIQIKIKMPNPSQEPTMSSNAPNQDLKDLNDLCTFKIKMRAKFQNMGVAKTSENIQIKIKMTNLTQDPPVSYNAPIRIQMTYSW